MWEFAKANPGWTFLIFWVAAWAATRPFWYLWSAYQLRLRSQNIAAHGWPPAPLDADGDVHHPDEDEQPDARASAR